MAAESQVYIFCYIWVYMFSLSAVYATQEHLIVWLLNLNGGKSKLPNSNKNVKEFSVPGSFILSIKAKIKHLVSLDVLPQVVGYKKMRLLPYFLQH